MCFNSILQDVQCSDFGNSLHAALHVELATNIEDVLFHCVDAEDQLIIEHTRKRLAYHMTSLPSGGYELNQRSICSRESKYPVGNRADPSGIGSFLGADPSGSRNANFFTPARLYCGMMCSSLHGPVCAPG